MFLGAAVIAFTATVILFALKSAGAWLVIEDALQPADAVVVLAGHIPLRATEAAAIYQQGWVREVWLTPGGPDRGESELSQLGSERAPEYVLSRKVLQGMGVPEHAIRLLPGATKNTAEELRVVAQELRASGGDRVILVTSKYHSRRVKVTWRQLVDSHLRAVVRYTPNDPAEPTRWWRNRFERKLVLHEFFGLLNAWVGFPTG